MFVCEFFFFFFCYRLHSIRTDYVSLLSTQAKPIPDTTYAGDVTTKRRLQSAKAANRKRAQELCVTSSFVLVSVFFFRFSFMVGWRVIGCNPPPPAPLATTTLSVSCLVIWMPLLPHTPARACMQGAPGVGAAVSYDGADPSGRDGGDAAHGRGDRVQDLGPSGPLL